MALEITAPVLCGVEVLPMLPDLSFTSVQNQLERAPNRDKHTELSVNKKKSTIIINIGLEIIM